MKPHSAFQLFFFFCILCWLLLTRPFLSRKSSDLMKTCQLSGSVRRLSADQVFRFKEKLSTVEMSEEGCLLTSGHDCSCTRFLPFLHCILRSVFYSSLSLHHKTLPSLPVFSQGPRWCSQAARCPRRCRRRSSGSLVRRPTGGWRSEGGKQRKKQFVKIGDFCLKHVLTCAP